LDNKKEKRELIIDASIKVFAKDGFHKAKVSEIAETAGIGKGTIYEYFKSKTQLFEEMIKHTLNVYLENAEIVIEKKISSRQKLKEFAQSAMDLTQQHMDIGRIYSQETGLVGENIIKIMLATQKRIVQMIEDVLQEGVEAEELRPVDLRIAALSFIGSLKHLRMYHYFIYKRNMTEEEIDNFIELYISGLKK